MILADMEKEEMEEELRNHNIDFLRSHVVCRSGSLYVHVVCPAMTVSRTARFSLVVPINSIVDAEQLLKAGKRVSSSALPPCKFAAGRATRTWRTTCGGCR